MGSSLQRYIPRKLCNSCGLFTKHAAGAIEYNPASRMTFRSVMAEMAAKFLSTMMVAIPVSRIVLTMRQISRAITGFRDHS